MPPKSPLSQREKSVLRSWLAAGAGWGTDPIDPYQATTSRRAGRDWWSLQPLSRPAAARGPEPRLGERTPIDRFILSKLEANGLSPTREADRRVLIRRVCFDLTGLPPEPEADRCVRSRSLARTPMRGCWNATWPRRNMACAGLAGGSTWLGMAKATGIEFDEFRPAAWRYRDWVVDSFNRDLPYDEFARLQLAGRRHPTATTPTPSRATGFLVAGAYDTVGQTQQSLVMRAVVRSDEIEDLVGTVGQTFLGVTVNCARCHDHKFDPIRQTEYYGIASALSGVRHGERDLAAVRSGGGRRARADRGAAVAGRSDRKAGARADSGRAPRESDATPPDPIAAWNFENGLVDLKGGLVLSLEGGAKLTPEGLEFDGKTALATSTAAQSRAFEQDDRGLGAAAKSLAARRRGDDDRRRGTASSSIRSSSESWKPAAGWPAATDSAGTRAFRARSRETLRSRPVHVAITYAADGTIADLSATGCRTANHTGPRSRRFSPAGRRWSSSDSRHTPAGANRGLAGTILRARLYDRALEPPKIAASAASFRELHPLDARSSWRCARASDGTSASGCSTKIEWLRHVGWPPIRECTRVAPREPGATHVEIRGNPNQPGEIVSPGRDRGDRRTRSRFRSEARRPRGQAPRATGGVGLQLA